MDADQRAYSDNFLRFLGYIARKRHEGLDDRAITGLLLTEYEARHGRFEPSDLRDNAFNDVLQLIQRIT